jgi:predicted nucleic acid-binding protein
LLLLDHSAWSRLRTGAIPKDRLERIADWVDRQRLGVCLPFLLEAGFSARSAGDRKELMARLEHLPRVLITDEVERAAFEAQQELAEVGHHRLPPTDLLIAACAARVGGGVLHYDRDYDLIAEHTGLSFESVWVAEAGTV